MKTRKNKKLLNLLKKIRIGNKFDFGESTYKIKDIEMNTPNGKDKIIILNRLNDRGLMMEGSINKYTRTRIVEYLKAGAIRYVK